MRVLATALLLVPLWSGSCAAQDLLRSRWAMDDPVYAQKYRDGAEQFDLLGKTKQALDARHLAGHRGFYLSGGYQDDPAEVAGEIGVFGHASWWLTVRGGAMLVGDATGGDYFGGLNLGARAQPPSRIAPFVGLGTFSGISKGTELADHDGRDNDDDRIVDEPGEENTSIDGWRTALYPEVGVHAWLNQRLRLTGSASYQFTTEGRDYDYWLFSLSLSWLPASSRGFSDAYDSAW